MTTYAVLFTSSVDDEFESGIVDNKVFSEEMAANTVMLEEAQRVVDDWNSDNLGRFELSLFPRVKSCSVTGRNESDFYELRILSLEQAYD